MQVYCNCFIKLNLFKYAFNVILNWEMVAFQYFILIVLMNCFVSSMVERDQGHGYNSMRQDKAVASS